MLVDFFSNVFDNPRPFGEIGLRESAYPMDRGFFEYHQISFHHASHWRLLLELFRHAGDVGFALANSVRLTTISQISCAARGFPSAFAARTIWASVVEPKSWPMRNGKSSTRFTFAAAPRSNRKSLLAASCPGIGFTINNGLPTARASEVVKPPGLVMISSAAAINSFMFEANPST